MAAADDLQALRLPLLALHKQVLATERRALERIHGELSGDAVPADRLRPGALRVAAAVLGADPRASTTRSTSQDDDENEIATPEEILDRARELLLPPKADTPFGRRYLSLHAEGARARARARERGEAPALMR